MKLSCEGIGKNIEQAIENALLELKVAREDVDIKILSEGGFLKKARVVVSISDDAVEKYQQRDAKREEILNEEKEEEKPSEKVEVASLENDDFVETFMKKKIASVENDADEQINGIKSDAPEKTSSDAKRVSAKDWICGLVRAFNLNEEDVEIERSEDERYVTYNIKGEGLNDLIGHHGDCMLALTQIMSLCCENENHKRIILDVESYRQKRRESLIDLAKRIANKVAKSGRYYKFEPMDASERKIIHTALQDDDRVTTLSKGEEPRRYLIIFPKEYRE